MGSGGGGGGGGVVMAGVRMASRPFPSPPLLRLRRARRIAHPSYRRPAAAAMRRDTGSDTRRRSPRTGRDGRGERGGARKLPHSPLHLPRLRSRRRQLGRQMGRGGRMGKPPRALTLLPSFQACGGGRWVLQGRRKCPLERLFAVAAARKGRLLAEGGGGGGTRRWSRERHVDGRKSPWSSS